MALTTHQSNHEKFHRMWTSLLLKSLLIPTSKKEKIESQVNDRSPPCFHLTMKSRKVFFESPNKILVSATIYTLLRVIGGNSTLVIRKKIKHSSRASYKEAQGLLLMESFFSSLFLGTPEELAVELALWYLSYSLTL